MDISDICGVLVAYKPDEGLCERLKTHLAQLSRLIVIQNGCGAEAEPFLQQFAHENPSMTLLTQTENNLARAQNVGILAARDAGAQAVLLLDDDSDMAGDMVQTLLAHLHCGVGLVAPHMVERATQRESRYVVAWLHVLFRRLSADQHDTITNAFNPIASGSLIPMAALEQVGLMDETFEIDYVDREFCLRLLVRGFETKIVSKAVLYHTIGQSHSENMAGLCVTTRNHPALRRRLIFRNRLRCWARYGLTVPSFLLYDILATGYDIFRIIFMESDKKAKLKAMMEGVLSLQLNKT